MHKMRKVTKKHLENLRILRERKKHMRDALFSTHRQKFSQMSNVL